MSLKIVLTVALCMCALASSAQFKHDDMDWFVEQQQQFMQLLRKTLVLNTRSTPEHLDDCFQYYTPKQTEEMEAYRGILNGCSQRAVDAKATLSAESSDKRDALLGSGGDSCSLLASCEEHDDGLEFFQCYHQNSNSEYQNIYGLGTQAESMVSYLQVKYSQIDNEEKKCEVDARNEYVRNLAAINTALQGCIDGDEVPSEEPEEDLKLRMVAPGGFRLSNILKKL